MIEATKNSLNDLELRMDESRARHFGVGTELGNHFRNWTDWIVCESRVQLPGAPDKPGIFALGRWVTAPAGQGYLILPFYYEQSENLATAVVPVVRAERIFSVYNIIESREHRQIVLAALRKKQVQNAEVDSVMGTVFRPVQDSNVISQLPASFPFC